MTDLINKINNVEVSEIQTLYKKFETLLNTIKPTENLPYVIYIINIAFNYLNTCYTKETSEWKTWTIVVLKKLFELKKINQQEDIGNIIDQFLIHKKTEYDKYLDNIGSYSDEYFRDLNFVNSYIKNYDCSSSNLV